MRINKYTDFNNVKIIEDINIFPSIRHFCSYDSAISILEKGVFMSRQELIKSDNIDIDITKNKRLESKDKWWNERKEIEMKIFKTENLIFCTPDWYSTYGNETGHGPVMFYFKPSIFENYKLTLTLLDNHYLSVDENKVYDSKEISKIYSNIINENNSSYKSEATKILKNLKCTNIGSVYETSRGRMYIDGGLFYNKYAEIQIHSNKIPIEYISEIKLTNNYLGYSESDNTIKEKFILLCKEKGIKIKNN